jgi:hypothetical protein
MSKFKKVLRLNKLLAISLFSLFIAAKIYAQDIDDRVCLRVPLMNGSKESSQRLNNLMKNLGPRGEDKSIELDLSVFHSYFIERSSSVEEKNYYGINAKVIEVNPDYFRTSGPRQLQPGAYHFSVKDEAGEERFIIVLNAYYIGEGEVYDEGIFHEAREIFWKGQGFSAHEAHVVASAEQVMKFSKGGTVLTDYHREQLKSMSYDAFEYILNEDSQKRDWHYDVLLRANGVKKTQRGDIFGEPIDFVILGHYAQMIRDPIQKTLHEKGNYNFKGEVFAGNTDYTLDEYGASFIQGIKLHINILDGDPRKVKDMLSAILDVVNSYKLPHKVIKNLQASRGLTGSQYGKTVTIYMLRQVNGEGISSDIRFLTNGEIQQLISILDDRLAKVSTLEENSFKDTAGEIATGRSGRIGMRMGGIFGNFFANVKHGESKGNLSLREISIDNRTYGNKFMPTEQQLFEDYGEIPEVSGIIEKRKIKTLLDDIFSKVNFASPTEDIQEEQVALEIEKRLRELLPEDFDKEIRVRPFGNRVGRNKKSLYIASIGREEWLIKLGDYRDFITGVAGTVWTKEFVISEKARDGGFLSQVLANNPVDFLHALGRKSDAQTLQEKLREKDWEYIKDTVINNFSINNCPFTVTRYEKKTVNWYKIGKKSKVEELDRLREKLKETGIVHRDIKPGNILYNPKEKIVKLIDFENAVLIENGELLVAPPLYVNQILFSSLACE